MSDWDRFNDQFAETEDERRHRRAVRTRRLIAEGKCWQCAKLIAECACPNVKHAQQEKAQS